MNPLVSLSISPTIYETYRDLQNKNNEKHCKICKPIPVEKLFSSLIKFMQVFINMLVNYPLLSNYFSLNFNDRQKNQYLWIAINELPEKTFSMLLIRYI